MKTKQKAAVRKILKEYSSAAAHINLASTVHPSRPEAMQKLWDKTVENILRVFEETR